MSDSSDPLGKRALFWAPAAREEDDPLRRERIEDRGRLALFSEATVEQPKASKRGGGAFKGLIGPIVLDCSSCGSRTEVEMFEFVLLHLPLWLWRPGKGYTSLMVCPSCRKRTWMSVSLPSWSR